MKKVALSLAGVLAAAAFAPEASAVPSFARQTGMACSACHYQHFPVLNGFGQSFKASGYTMMGAQGKVEGEHLSIPDTLNASILLKARYQKTDGTDPVGTIGGDTTNSGQWQIPDELSLFFGGRIADSDLIKIGFMNENNMAGSPMVAGFKIPVVVDLGAAKVMAIPYITDALGVAYGFEQSSTGMTRGVRWAEHRSDVSAAQYTGIGSGTASGVALVLHTDMGYINVSKWSPAFAYIAGTTGVGMGSTWVRVAATPTVADWALHIGVGIASGASRADAASPSRDTKGTVIDLQAQGAVAGMETSFYFQNATANKTTATSTNAFNSKVTDKKAMTIGADFSVIPHALHLGVALRSANTGVSAAEQTAGAGDKDNSTTITAVYDLFQNVALHLNHSMRSGSAYNATTGTKAANVAVGGEGKTLTTFMLEAAW